MPPVTARPDRAVDVILRDGTTLRLRQPQPPDGDALLSFFSELSPESLHSRFHGGTRIDRSLVEHLLSQSEDRDALVAIVGDGAATRIVALAEFARLRDPAVAEVAFAVADELQGRGVGTRLLEQLAARAGAVGVERFVAQVLPENRAMLGVFADAGFDVARELGGGEVEVRFPIAATDSYRARVDERDHIAVAASLRPFFAPASVAVVGASRRRAQLAASSSAISLPPTSPARPTPLTAAASLSPVSPRIARWPTSPSPSTSPSSACPRGRSSTLPRRRLPPACARSASSRRASPRS